MYGKVIVPEFPVADPVQDTTPVPVPVTTILPSEAAQADGFVTVPVAIVG